MMRLATYNIQFGRGLDGVVDLNRIAEVIKQSDIVALQEVDRFWTRSGNQDQMAILQKLLPEFYMAFGAGVDFAAPNTAPNSSRVQFGNAIFSRFPIIASRNFLFRPYATVGQFSLQKNVVQATIQVGRDLVCLHSAHLTHLSEKERIYQVEQLLSWAGECFGQPLTWFGQPDDDWKLNEVNFDKVYTIFAGDFNMTPDSPEYQLMVGEESARYGTLVKKESFYDAYVLAGHAKLSGKTGLDQRKSETVWSRVDYIFLPNELKNQVRGAWIGYSAKGSDHPPFYLELDLDPI